METERIGAPSGNAPNRWNSLKNEDLCIGLAGLDLKGETIELGHGIVLRATYAHLFGTDILAFERPATPTSYHPGPWQAVRAKPGVDILAELIIPPSYRHEKARRILVAHTIATLLRLWTDPKIARLVMAPCSMAKLKESKPSPTGGELVAALTPLRDRHVQLGLINEDNIIPSIQWVVEHWQDAVDLRVSSTEFDFALETFENAQFIPNTAMMLVSIWGALEAIFAPHKQELTFRVSSMLAAYLAPRGQQRADKQKEILRLYGARSAAAHGSPKHGPEDLVATFTLLRMAIIRMIERKAVPTRLDLEQCLFAG